MSLLSKQIIIHFTLAALSYSTFTLAELQDAPKQIVVANAGFLTPESIEYYADEDVYLVSNINGSAIAAEGNGFISKVKPNGSIVELKWIDGTKPGILLNSPKGIVITGNKLYVADINQVHIFELPSGKQLKTVTIAGSTFLNGITPGGQDSIYVTDSGLGSGPKAPKSTNGIYRVTAQGHYRLLVKEPDMGRPNGIITQDKELTFVTFGTGELIKIDTQGQRFTLPTPPKGALDGLIQLTDGRLIISSWDGAALYILNTDQTYKVLAENLDAPADLGFDTKRQRVLVPLFKQNKLVFIPL